MADSQEPYQSAKTIAKRLGVSYEFVLKLGRNGKIPCLRLGTKVVRFNIQDVMQALRAYTEEVHDKRMARWKTMGDHARQKSGNTIRAKQGVKRLEVMGIL